MNLRFLMTHRETTESPTPARTTLQRPLPSAKADRKLVYSIVTGDDWEILIYQRSGTFEACFFRWAFHHEHTSGSSFEAVTRQVEQRIRILKSRRLKTVRWRRVVH